MNSLLSKTIGQTAQAGDRSSVENTSESVRKAATDFESFFVGSIFEEIQKSIPKSEVFGQEDMGMDIYQGMFMQEIVKNAAQGKGFGLADSLVKQFEKSHPAPKDDATKNILDTGLDNKTPLEFQVPSERIVTSKFGLRVDPLNGTTRQHDGIDYAMPVGTPVKAARAGTVVFSGPKGGYGNAVMIDHGNGYTSLYGHQSKTNVKSGEHVSKGQIIGLSGSTGRSTGPHLHFEVRHLGEPVNPQGFQNDKKDENNA